MTKYKITYESLINDIDSDGKWRKETDDNKGQGYELDEAADAASQLKAMSFPTQNSNIKILEMEV